MSLEKNTARAKADLDAVYAAGKKAKSLSLMVAVQQGGERTSYSDLFASPYWTDENFEPIYDIRTTSALRMFHNCRITDLVGILERQGVVLDTSGTGNFYLFMSQSTITRVPAIDVSAASNLSQSFYGCTNMVSIERLILSSDGATTFDNTFYNCNELIHLEVDGIIGKQINLRYSPKLSRASITSVVAALSTATDKLTVTFSEAAVKKAFEKSEGANDGNTSPAWAALKLTRNNWNFVLA